jgi:hypothetical protein
MFQQPSAGYLEDQTGVAGDCGFSQPGEGCTGGRGFDAVLLQAATLFVGLRAHPGARQQAASAEWLLRSPCHECAWRRVQTTWDALAGLPPDAVQNRSEERP